MSLATGFVLDCIPRMFAAVLLILGVFAVFGTQATMGISPEANLCRAREDLKNIAIAVDLYRLEHRELPPSLDALGGRFLTDSGPFVDPWGNRYALCRDIARPFFVASHGPDGVCGTEDDVTSADRR